MAISSFTIEPADEETLDDEEEEEEFSGLLGAVRTAVEVAEAIEALRDVIRLFGGPEGKVWQENLAMMATTLRDRFANDLDLPLMGLEDTPAGIPHDMWEMPNRDPANDAWPETMDALLTVRGRLHVDSKRNLLGASRHQPRMELYVLLYDRDGNLVWREKGIGETNGRFRLDLDWILGYREGEKGYPPSPRQLFDRAVRDIVEKTRIAPR